MRRVRPGQPWLLNYRHRPLTANEASDDFGGIPIVVPLRNNVDRVASLLRFNVLQYERGRGLRVYLGPRMTLAWNPRVRSAEGRRFYVGACDRARVHNATMMASEMPSYIGPDGQTIMWREWAAAALGAGASPFWYSTMLPGLESTDDPRWQRLIRVPVSDLNRWFAVELGVRLPRLNTTEDHRTSLDVDTAVRELKAHAAEYTVVDERIWGLLNQA